MRTPLFLTLLAEVFSSSRSLPARPVDVFGELLNNLLRLPMQEKGESSPLRQREKGASLQPLALHMMKEHKTQITFSEAALVIDRPLEALDLAWQHGGKVFVGEVKKGQRLLEESQTGVLRFAHRSIQEFLAASRLREIDAESELGACPGIPIQVRP